MEEGSIFVNFADSFDPTINFTCEMSSESAVFLDTDVSFLGMMIEKKGCELVTSVYRKPTNNSTFSEPRGYALQEIID